MPYSAPLLYIVYSQPCGFFSVTAWYQADQPNPNQLGHALQGMTLTDQVHVIK